LITGGSGEAGDRLSHFDPRGPTSASTGRYVEEEVRSRTVDPNLLCLNNSVEQNAGNSAPHPGRVLDGVLANPSPILWIA